MNAPLAEEENEVQLVGRTRGEFALRLEVQLVFAQPTVNKSQNLHEFWILDEQAHVTIYRFTMENH